MLLSERLIEETLKEDDAFIVYSQPFPIDEINELVVVINSSCDKVNAAFVIDRGYFEPQIIYGGRLVVRKKDEVKREEKRQKMLNQK